MIPEYIILEKLKQPKIVLASKKSLNQETSKSNTHTLEINDIQSDITCVRININSLSMNST